jgi:enoyl-CoA hydratase/carnithine racemase
MSELVIVTDDGGVRTIRLNRPEKKNALTQAMYADLTRALREADASTSIRCVLLAGAPGVFCAGNDIADFLAAAQGGGADLQALTFITEIARNQTPKVAAVGGVAVGIGTTMLLHCDHVVANAAATFSTPFLKLGLLPEAASTLLAPMRMGYARAFSMLAMGRPLSAAEAQDAGLVNAVVDAAELDAVALAAAREIAALPPTALALTRGLMRGNVEDIVQRLELESMHLRELLQSDEARAAFQAFLARKK